MSLRLIFYRSIASPLPFKPMGAAPQQNIILLSQRKSENKEVENDHANTSLRPCALPHVATGTHGGLA